MFFVDVECMDSEKKPYVSRETVYEMKDLDRIPWQVFSMMKKVRQHKKYYYNIPCAFDIETTSIVKPYTALEKEKFAGKRIENFRPYAFMYQWQFAIDTFVIMGRRWDEFINLLLHVKKHMGLDVCNRLVVYVHNYPFEFQFMRNFIPFSEVFATDERAPIKALAFGAFEFRCSYRLSNMSLEKFCENERGVKHYKLADTYDYSKIRTAATALTNEELSYCYNDVAGLVECIKSKMEEDDLASIPLTSTGYVRRDFRDAMSINPKNRKIFTDTALTPELYQMFKEGFRGGDVHANILYSRQTLFDVHSYDRRSSYPAEMMMNEFPMGRFTRVTPASFENRDWTGYAWIARIRMKDVRYIGNTGNPYISSSKTSAISRNTKEEIGNLVLDNGRVLYAKYVEMVVTDVDMKIIESEYKYDDFWIKDIHVSKYGELPDEYKSMLMRYYTDKTALKNIPEKEYEYGKAKNRLNSGYGMTVTDIVREIVEYNLENGWISSTGDTAEMLQKFYKSKNSFLPYQWGIWVTAHARYALREGMGIVGKSNAYNDTDSIKTIHPYFDEFKSLNEKITEKAMKAGAYAETAKGECMPMGVWEYEGCYEKFRALGSKKYVVQTRDENGNPVIKSTIAGVGKKKGAAFFMGHGIESFDIGLVIPDSGHLTATYNDVESPYHIIIDGCDMVTGSNICLQDGTYEVNETDGYLRALTMMKKGVMELD